MKRLIACAAMALAVSFCAHAQQQQTAPSKPAENCGKLHGAFLDLEPTPFGYIFTAEVAGEKRRFLLDMTQPFSIISETVADGMHLEAKKLPNGFSVFFAMQNLSKYAVLPSLRLGPIPFPPTDFILWKKMDQSRMPPRDGDNPSFKVPDIDGVIGINVLARLDFELDLKNNKLGLFLPDHCPFIPDWGTGTATGVPFEVDMSWNALSIPAQLDDKPIHIAFNTSEKETSMMAYRASKIFGIDVFTHGLETRPMQFGMTRYTYPFKKLSAGGLAIDNPKIVLLGPLGGACNDQHNRGFEYICYRRDMGDVIVGTNVLAGLHIFFAQKQKIVYFASQATPPPPSADTPKTAE